ncbi:MAG: hypothetical protein U0527_17345 [Candidatus Eisenbacteria bacterium]
MLAPPLEPLVDAAPVLVDDDLRSRLSQLVVLDTPMLPIAVM